MLDVIKNQNNNSTWGHIYFIKTFILKADFC